MKRTRRAGFTLVELLIVLAIIGILAAVLFPAFRAAQEKGRQSACASTLSQIGVAVQQYYQDEKRYPASLAFLLAPETKLTDYSVNPPAPDPTPRPGGGGYLKISEPAPVCPGDDTNVTYMRSSYGDVSKDISNPGTSIPASEQISRSVWNYFGYKADGTAYRTVTEAKTAIEAMTQQQRDLVLVAAGKATYDVSNGRPNPDNAVKLSLSNRFAPQNTIVTHCVYHRIMTSNANSPEVLYDIAKTSSADAQPALDIVLRLDGSAKTVNVGAFDTAVISTDTPPKASPWQTQNVNGTRDF